MNRKQQRRYIYLGLAIVLLIVISVIEIVHFSNKKYDETLSGKVNESGIDFEAKEDKPDVTPEDTSNVTPEDTSKVEPEKIMEAGVEKPTGSEARQEQKSEGENPSAPKTEQPSNNAGDNNVAEEPSNNVGDNNVAEEPEKKPEKKPDDWFGKEEGYGPVIR